MDESTNSTKSTTASDKPKANNDSIAIISTPIKDKQLKKTNTTPTSTEKKRKKAKPGPSRNSPSKVEEHRPHPHKLVKTHFPDVEKHRL